MIECARCGYKNDAAAKFCAACGAPMMAAQVQAPQGMVSPGIAAGYPAAAWGPPPGAPQPPAQWGGAAVQPQPMPQQWGPAPGSPMPGVPPQAPPQWGAAPQPYPGQPQPAPYPAASPPWGAPAPQPGYPAPAPQSGYAAPAPQQPQPGYPAPAVGAPGWGSAASPAPAPLGPTAPEATAVPAVVPTAASAVVAPLEPDEIPANAPKTLAAFLVTFDSDPLGQFWPLFQGQTLVGRKDAGGDLNLEIDHPTTSSRHAKIYVAARPGRLKVEDLGSTNGTYVNERRLEPGERRSLEAGDTLRFGGFSVTVIPV